MQPNRSRSSVGSKGVLEEEGEQQKQSYFVTHRSSRYVFRRVAGVGCLVGVSILLVHGFLYMCSSWFRFSLVLVRAGSWGLAVVSGS